MKALQKIVQFFLFILIILIGLDYLLGGIGRLGAHPVLDPFFRWMPWITTPEAGTRMRLFWLGVVLLPLLYWAAGYVRWRRQRGVFRVETSNGETILLHPGVLIKFARLQIANHPAVVSQKVHVKQTGHRSLTIYANVTVRTVSSLPAISSSLEQRLRHGFGQVMGIERFDKIEIRVSDFDEKSVMRHMPAEALPAPAPEPPVRATTEPAAPAPAPEAAPVEQHEGELVQDEPEAAPQSQEAIDAEFEDQAAADGPIASATPDVQSGSPEPTPDEERKTQES